MIRNSRPDGFILLCDPFEFSSTFNVSYPIIMMNSFAHIVIRYVGQFAKSV
jgi:hypothetical protein